MANSKAKKKRLKQLREQGKDVTIQRGMVHFSTHERITKTKTEALNKHYKKNKRHFRDNICDHPENAFYFYGIRHGVKRYAKRVNCFAYLKLNNDSIGHLKRVL